MVKKIALVISLVLISIIVWKYDLIIYGISQAKGQLKIILESRPIDEVLADPMIPDSLKNKIELVQEVREFAIDSLGLNDSDSYHTLYNQHGKPVLWVVTACDRFSLKDKKWTFPLLGSFSYKGFFDYQKALDEKLDLMNRGYDTGIRTVSAWSTLGFLNDPIMSGILFNSVGSLANTIIHELTHSTVFVKDDLQFNESLASFVGHQGALRFLEFKYGKSSYEYHYYETYTSDRALFVNHMLDGTKLLDSVYSSFTRKASEKDKETAKSMAITSIFQTLDTLAFQNPYYQNLSQSILSKDTLPNNTYFKSYVRYQSRVGDFEKVFLEQCHGDVKVFIEYLKQTYESI